MTTDYFRVRTVSEDEAHQLLIDPLSPNWGGIPHYLSSEEALRFGFGAFDPERIQYYWDKSGRFFPDFLPTFYGVITAKIEVLETFKGLLLDHSCCFGLNVSGQKYLTLKPKKYLELMDTERSIFSILPSGSLDGPRELVLSEPPSNEVSFFGISYKGMQTPNLVVSASIKHIYDENGFSGLRFKKVWPIQ